MQQVVDKIKRCLGHAFIVKHAPAGDTLGVDVDVLFFNIILMSYGQRARNDLLLEATLRFIRIESLIPSPRFRCLVWFLSSVADGRRRGFNQLPVNSI